MKKLILFFVSSALFISVLTNDYVFAQKAKKDSLVNKKGPKSKDFANFYIGIGFMAGPSVGQGGDVVSGKSDNFTIGIKYKRRFSNIESIGAYLAYDADLYRLNQNNTLHLDSLNGAGKTTKVHDKEDLIYYAFTLGIYNRFNFKKNRGNKLGTYLDLGGYGSWNFSINHYTKDLINGNTLKDYTSGLAYPQRICYGLYAQLGIGKFSIYFKKRVSNLFKEKYYNMPYNFAELPRFECGLQIAVF